MNKNGARTLVRIITHGLKSALLGTLLISCSNTKQQITGYSRGGLPIGNLVTQNFLYGKSQADSSLFGLTHITNLDVGFKYLTQATLALTTAYIAGDVRKVTEITQQMREKGISEQQIASINAQAAAAAAAEKSKLLLANPSAVKPAATILSAP